MKLDFKKFKKVSADENKTVLEHEKGHKIHIAHKSLEPKMRKQLEKMEMHYADGGFVDEPVPMASSLPTEEQQIMQMAQQMPQQMPAPMIEKQQDIAVSQAMNPPQQQVIEPTAPPSVLPSAAIEGIGEEQQAAQAIEPTAQEPKKQDDLGYNAYESSIMRGVSQQEEGIRKEAEAKQLQAIEEQRAAEQAQKTTQELQSQYQKHFDELEQDRKHFEEDLSKQRVDPNRFYNNMSTSQRISTGIGMILGGMGAGLTGGENPVMKMINNQIDADIEAQKADLGKKQNLLTANMHHFGNLKDATEMTKAQNLDMLKIQMQRALSKSNNPQANAIMMQEIGKLDQQVGAIRQKIAMKRTAADFMQNANKDPAKVPVMLNLLEASGDPELKGMAKEVRGRYVPGVGVASVEVPNNIREKIIAGKSLEELIARVREFGNKHRGNLSGLSPTIRAEGQQLTSLLMDAYRTAKAQGVFKEAEKEFDETIIPQSPTSLYENTVKGTDQRYQNLQQIFHREHSNLLKGYGLKRNTGTLNVMPPKI